MIIDRQQDKLGRFQCIKSYKLYFFMPNLTVSGFQGERETDRGIREIDREREREREREIERERERSVWTIFLWSHDP